MLNAVIVFSDRLMLLAGESILGGESMRSHLSKSWVYAVFLVASLLLTGISVSANWDKVQLTALVPFNAEPLFMEPVNLPLPQRCG